MHPIRQSVGSALVLLAVTLTACADWNASAVENNAAAVPAETQPQEASNSAVVVEDLPVPSPAQTSDSAACHTQDGRKIAPAQIEAIGTEPFWNARIDGRCVTYSTPDDQAGKRIWTHFAGKAEDGIWSGALDGRQFELRTRKALDCSDGMSDNRYPLEVTLRVGGETRQGCAEPS
jgi:uncharacterized membrane protein